MEQYKKAWNCEFLSDEIVKPHPLQKSLNICYIKRGKKETI